MFRYKRGIKVDYRQGYIYFSSLSYESLSNEQKQKILRLCEDCGGNNSNALLDFVTTDQTATAICMKYYIASKTTLYWAVKRYYERFPMQI